MVHPCRSLADTGGNPKYKMHACATTDSTQTDAGTTVGNVWLYDDLDGAARHRHEARHADEWALLGPAFPGLYAAEFARTGGRQQNVFEQWAGLHDGGYLHAR